MRPPAESNSGSQPWALNNLNAFQTGLLWIFSKFQMYKNAADLSGFAIINFAKDCLNKHEVVGFSLNTAILFD